MARITPPKNHAAFKVIIDGDGPRDAILVSDQTDGSTRLANIVVVDRDTLPEHLHNIVTTSSTAFEVRDGGLYLREGVALAPGRYRVQVTATDEGDPKLSKSATVTVTVTHVEAIATLTDGTLKLNYDGAFTITRNGDGGWHILSNSLGMDLSASQVAGISGIQLHGGNTLSLAAAAIDGLALTIHGSPTQVVDITGVTFTESLGGASVDSNVDISHLSVDSRFMVGGRETDAFKAMWNYLDDAYAFLQGRYGNTLMFGLGGYAETDVLPDGMTILGHTTAGAAALAVNEAMTTLNLAYATYLDNGGSPNDLVEFIAKSNGGGTRFQSMHDNLLGGVNASNIGDRNFPDDVEAQFISQIPGDFGSRPYASGNVDVSGRADASTNLAKAWDYAHGYERPDYEVHFTGAIDPSGTKPGGDMMFGAGNPSTGYTIAVHEGEGVEFGWNVHYRTGDQISGHQGVDGLVHFDAPAGHQAGTAHNVQGDNLNRSAVSVDYAEVTGLNGTGSMVQDYVTIMKIDVDPTAGTNFKVFTLQHAGPGAEYFLMEGGAGGFGNEDGASPYLAENSINFGYGFLSNSQTLNTGDMQAGTYDLIAEVWNSEQTVQLVANHIVLDVA